MSDVVDGGCFCGAVKVSVTLPVATVFHCHCTICRRMHGAPFATWVVVPEAGLTVSGARLTFASSDQATRERCASCGAPVLLRTQRAPGRAFVSRGLFADDAPLEAKWHGFWGDRAKWVDVQDGLEKRG